MVRNLLQYDSPEMTDYEFEKWKGSFPEEIYSTHIYTVVHPKKLFQLHLS